MGRPSRFSPEVRERAVRMVEEHRATHASEWGVLQSVAPKLGCTAETLRKWVRQAQRDAGYRPGLTTSERERRKELEREVRELKRANEILRKASAYVAQAELDGVVARIVTGPHDAHRQDPHRPMRYDTARPSSVIRLRISQPRTTSLSCPAGLRARRPSPMMDVSRKNVFSTRL